MARHLTRRASLAAAALAVLLVSNAPASAASSETISVSNADPTPVTSTTVLQPDHQYRIAVSGTASDWCPESGGCAPPLVLDQGVDALYCYATWRCPTPQLWHPLLVNGEGLDQLAGLNEAIPYNPAGAYAVTVSGISGSLTFVGADAVGSASDNSGTFAVSITDLGSIHAALAFVLPGPQDISLAPQDVARSIGLTLLVMLFVAAPTPLFNNTLENNLEDIRHMLHLDRLRGNGVTGALTHGGLGLVVYLAIAAFFYALLDQAFPGPDAVEIYLAGLVGLVALNVALALPADRYVSRRFHVHGALRVAQWTLILAAVCVLITRVTGVQPGYIYGIVGTVAFTVPLSRKDHGQIAFRGAAALLLLALVAWFARIPFQPPVGQPPEGLALVADRVLVAIFVTGVEGLVFGLIPITFMLGHSLRDWSTVRWLVLWAIGILLFAHVILYPVSDYEPNPDTVGIWTVVLTVAIYSAVAVGFWWFFRQRERRREQRDALSAARLTDAPASAARLTDAPASADPADSAPASQQVLPDKPALPGTDHGESGATSPTSALDRDDQAGAAGQRFPAAEQAGVVARTFRGTESDSLRQASLDEQAAARWGYAVISRAWSGSGENRQLTITYSNGPRRDSSVPVPPPTGLALPDLDVKPQPSSDAGTRSLSTQAPTPPELVLPGNARATPAESGSLVAAAASVLGFVSLLVALIGALLVAVATLTPSDTGTTDPGLLEQLGLGAILIGVAGLLVGLAARRGSPAGRLGGIIMGIPIAALSAAAVGDPLPSLPPSISVPIALAILIGSLFSLTVFLFRWRPVR